MATDPTPNKNTTTGGGCLIAVGLILGPVVGLFFGEVSAGLFAGGVIGIIAAVAWAIYDSRK